MHILNQLRILILHTQTTIVYKAFHNLQKIESDQHFLSKISLSKLAFFISLIIIIFARMIRNHNHLITLLRVRKTERK